MRRAIPAALWLALASPVAAQMDQGADEVRASGPTTTSTPTPSSTSTSRTSTTSTTSTSRTIPTTPVVTTTSAPSSTSSTSTSSTTSTLPPASGLVAAYGCDEARGTTLVDQSGLGNHGTLDASGVEWVEGKFGGALRFSGGVVTVADAASLDATTALTIEAWIRRTSTGPWSILVDKTQTGSPTNYYLGLYGTALTFGYYNRGWRDIDDGAVPADWTHVAAVYEAGTARLYVNAGTPTTQAGLPALLPNAMPLLLGRGYVGEEFRGDADEIRIYRRALTQAEIAADRIRPIGGSPVPTTSSTSSSTASTTSTSSSSSSVTSTTSSTTTSTVMCPSVVPCP